MWTVTLDGRVLHKPLTTATTLPKAELSVGLNSAGSLVFSIYREHPLYNDVLDGVLTASVKAYRDGEEMFSGRIIRNEPDYLTGMVTATCEGDLARLNDSVVPPYDFSGSPAQFIDLLLDAHNSQSSFTIGRGIVTVEDGNDYIVRSNSSPSRTWAELSDKTFGSSLGGYVQVAYEDGAPVLDWLAAPLAGGSQGVELGVNLLSLDGVSDGSSVVTAIYPVGARSTDNGVTTAVGISGLPDGPLGNGVSKRGAYVVNDSLYAKFGWIADVRSWDDVHYPDILQRKAAAEAAGLAFEQELSVSAVDLADAGYSVDRFSLGQQVEVKANDIEGVTMITAMTYDLLDPAAATMSFGAVSKSSAARAAESASAANAAANAAAWAQATASFGNEYLFHSSQGSRGDTVATAFPRSSSNFYYDESGAIHNTQPYAFLSLTDLYGDGYARLASSGSVSVDGYSSAELTSRFVLKNGAQTGARAFAEMYGGRFRAGFQAGTHRVAVYDDGTYEGFPESSYTLPPATSSSLGGIVVGSGLSITETGVLAADEYTLPTATGSRLGGVKIGTGFTYTTNGTLSVNAGSGWKTVSVNKSLFPSGYSTTRDVTVLKNDLLKLVYINAVYDTDGTAVSVPGNSVICVINDSSLRSGQTLNVGYGLRYSADGLADWTARVYPYSSTYAAIKTPTWSFSGTSVKFQTLLPYSALGL